MPIINSIPENYQSGFKELSKLNEEDFDKLKDVLEKITFASSIDGLLVKIHESSDFDSMTIGFNLDDIFLSISSVISFIESKDVINEIANDITNLCVEYELIKDGQQKDYLNKLEYLLSRKQIYYSSKAEDLLNDYGNAFVLSRVVSDIRPIFDIDLNEEIKAAMIIHNLTIHYQSDNEPFHKNITLTLSPKNIKELREILNRAEVKEINLKSVLEKSNVVYLNE